MHTFRIQIDENHTNLDWPFICTPRFIQVNGSGSSAKLLKFLVDNNLKIMCPFEVRGTVLSILHSSTFGWFDFKDNGAYFFQHFLAALKLYCKENNLTEITIKLPPQSRLIDYPIIINNLERFGYVLTKTEVNSIVKVGQKQLTKGRQYEIKKSQKNNITINSNPYINEQEFCLLQDNLKKHNTSPLHTLLDLNNLKNAFHDKVMFYSCYHNLSPVSLVVVFDYGKIMHSQYIASNAYGRDSGAQDMLLDKLITDTHINLKDWSFGTSNEPGTNDLNIGLYKYKKSFGAVAELKQSFKLTIK